MRSIAVLLGLAIAWIATATSALAQNGLERFERDIKPHIELQKFTYGNAQALGLSGFVLNDVVAVVPASPATNDKPSTLKIEKVTVEELDFDRLKFGDSDDLPRFAKVRFEGMTGDDELFTSLAPYGVPKVPVDATIDFRLDSAAKVFSMNKLEINLRGQATLAIAFVMEGISDEASKVESAKDDGRLRTATLTLTYSGLLAKMLPALAKEQGSNADAFVSLALMSIAGFAGDQGAPTQKVLDAVASFIGDWKAPKGPLAIGIKPAKTAGISDLDKVMEPNALVDVFGLNASYSGTRAGAAKTPPMPK